MSSLEGSITLQAFGAALFLFLFFSFFSLSAFFIDAFTEICRKNTGRNINPFMSRIDSAQAVE